MDTPIEVPNIYKTYEAIIGPLTPYIADRLELIAEDYGEHNVETALNEAKKYKKTGWNYIEAILRNMKESGKLIIIRRDEDYASWND